LEGHDFGQKRFRNTKAEIENKIKCKEKWEMKARKHESETEKVKHMDSLLLEH
jgi:hypothetical protein